MLLNSSSFLSSFILYTVNVVDGENLTISKVSRLHMGAYLCIASNGVPPSISKRVMLMVQCKYFYSFTIVITCVSLTLVNIMQSQVFRSRSCVDCDNVDKTFHCNVYELTWKAVIVLRAQHWIGSRSRVNSMTV